MSTEIRIALVYQQDAGTQNLRAALANAGVVVAVESRASELDPTVIFASDVDAIVVNLDAELEELLDEVTDALDSAAQPVIYNDPAASSDLSGWDRARWLRHLAAKLKGQTNFTPPPPPGAELIPVPQPKTVELPKPAIPLVAEAGASAPPAVAAPAAEAAPATESADVPFDLGFGDLDLMFETSPAPDAGAGVPIRPQETANDKAGAESAASPADNLFELGLADFDLMFEEPAAAPQVEPVKASAEPAVSAPAAAATLPADAAEDLGLADLDAMFELPPEAPAEDLPARPQSLMVGEDIGDLDALFAQPQTIDDSPITDVAVGSGDAGEFELDAMFAEAETPPSGKLAAPTASTAELTDLDALFREFEASQAAAEQAAPAAPTPAKFEPEPSAPAKPVVAKAAALDWSLEPVEDLAPKPLQNDKLIAEWRLDGPSKPLSQAPAQPAAPPPAAKSASGPAIPAHLEASLALADLKLLDDVDLGGSISGAADADAGALAELESLHLSAMDLDSQPDALSPKANDLGNDLGLADLDFDLDLGSSDLSTPPIEVRSSNQDMDLGDLDSLFEPVAETVAGGISLADLNRVFVLGASIGGPEAIKSFLATLPASVPAAFIIAQHMGAEFLEMMATQLNAATALSVRTPKSGERLRHGEVIVAPANEQLTINELGQVQLSAASSGSPYNPSIDQLTRDAANRFGDHATLILFSGMGSDAVEGGRYLAARGGQVWAQDRGSCVIASMIDSAKSQGLIRFEGTPAQLAERVLQVVS